MTACPLAHGTIHVEKRYRLSPNGTRVERRVERDTGIVIRVVAEVGDKRVPMLWVVMMDKPEDALAAVRFYLAPECDVELTDYRISAETIRALGLVPGQVRQL